MKILYVASEAPEAESLAVAREIMDLQQSLSESSSDVLKTVFLPDITIEELPIALSKHKPDILHIAVHGSKAGLWFTKEAFNGGSRELVKLSGEALANFLEPDRPPRLIFLNACESSNVAKTLAERGFLAIGTTAPITNQAAIAATRLLYDRILNGRHISEAFRAMDGLVSSLQTQKIKLNLAVPKDDTADRPLFRRPTLVARLADQIKIKEGRALPCYLGLAGVPADTIQVVFFTHDNSFLLTDRENSLEEELSEIIQDTVRGGEIWTETTWMPTGNFRFAACGITADGRTFSTSGMLVDSLDIYLKMKPTSPAYRKAFECARIILLKNENDADLSGYKGSKED
ncbi:CHAT domain-containing protein [Rhizobium laguerreae]|uniref:CHAT domain-containing protein n=1 Tax=Rhizobium laguerreae TaxID=1076926 RepID=UPI001C91FC7E|nr:CHAT domain-containing protein [Rhizobium laguerreae]MBY3468673.1 CHAT domain-containing protein [Rhizobium laguerreae]